jgi:hypothetical protein
LKLATPTAVPALACLAAIAACGSLSGSTDQPSALATIHGTLEGSQSVSPGSGPLAVAIVWQNWALGSPRVVAPSVAFRPTFPSSFSLDLTDVLPESVTFPAPIAVGLLFVYEDVNQNKQLDLVAPGAPAYVDKIVGGSVEYEIIYVPKPYLQSQPFFPIVGTDGSVLQAGYSWVRVHRWDCEPGDGPCRQSFIYRSIDTPVTFHMFELPWEQAEADTAMCTVVQYPPYLDGPATGSSSPLIPESPANFGGPLPSSDDPELLCDSPTSFRYNENCTTTGPGVCFDYTTTCTQAVQVTLPPGLAAPVDWPCVPQTSF